MLDKPWPPGERGEVHHLANRSTQLAGFTLTALAIIVGFYGSNKSTLNGPVFLLLVSFIFFLSLSQYTRLGLTIRQFLIADIGQIAGSIFLAVAIFWVFWIVFGVFPILISILAFLYILFEVINLYYSYSDIKKLQR